MSDDRIAYGAGCVWWGSIDQVGVTERGLPCCPLCGGMLFEVENEAEWWRAVDRGFDRQGLNGSLAEYRRFLEWSRGRCFPNVADALLEYPGPQ